MITRVFEENNVNATIESIRDISVVNEGAFQKIFNLGGKA